MSDRIKSDLRREVVAANVMAPSKSALTKSAILNAAMQFLETHQFRNLTVGILMAKTGYSRATFYQYFNDLHGLMETLLDGVKGGIVDGAQPWLTGEGEPVSSLQLSLRSLVDVGYEHGFILKAVAEMSDVYFERDKAILKQREKI
jgi:AcrR family transcriptional regulator